VADPAWAGRWSEHISCSEDMRCSRCGAVEPYPDPGDAPEPENITDETPFAVAYELRRKAKAQHDLDLRMRAVWDFVVRHRDCAVST